MELKREMYPEIKRLAIQAGLETTPIDSLLSILSKKSAQMCSSGNPNTIGRLVLQENNYDTLFGADKSLLGEGTYGEVYLTSTGSVNKNSKVDFISSDIREISILNYLSHPNVVCIYAVKFNLNDKLTMGMPAADFTLRNYKMKDAQDRKNIYYQLFRGLAYIHSKHVWHLDMKPANVLIYSNSGKTIAKIADFGMAIPYARKRVFDNPKSVITLYWRSPENFLGIEDFDERADVWSLGVMFLDSIVSTLNNYTFGAPTPKEVITLIFETLGWPDKNDWDENIEGRLKKVGFKSLEIEELKKRTGILNMLTINKYEMDIISKTVTWMDKRSSANEILALPYFKDETVESYLPADPVDIKPCGLSMVDDLNPVFKNNNIIKFITKILSLSTNPKAESIKMSYYAAELLSKYNAKGHSITDDTTNASVGIAISFINLYTSDKSDFNSSALLEIKKILIAVDFNLVFPTCYDFLMEYVEEHSPFYLDHKKALFKILIFVYLFYAPKYTSDKVAQIALAATGFSVGNGLKMTCSAGLDIYTDEIYNDLLLITGISQLVQPPM